MSENMGIPELGEALLTRAELAPYLANLVEAALDLAQAAGEERIRAPVRIRYALPFAG
jgi:hypothetical protein